MAGPPATDNMAIAALVCGILGITTFWLCLIGAVPSILGIVFGVIGKSRVDKSGGRLQGRGMALAGIICGSIGVVLAIGLIVLFIVSDSSTSYNNGF